MSMFTTARRSDDVRVREVLDHVAAHLAADLAPSGLRPGRGVSARHLFVGDIGEPPGQAVRRIRLEVAARLVATTDLPLSHVARRCGFSSAETLRQTFVGRYGIAPSRFRPPSPPAH